MKNMRKRFLILAGVLLGGLVAVLGIRAMSGSARQPSASAVQPKEATAAGTAARGLTPADRQISTAQSFIERTPSSPGGYNLLAAAFMQKARETGDFGYNGKAEAALKRSLEIAPDNFDAINLQAKLLLTFHRFREALDAARRAQAIQPQNHDVYGAMTDALVELGDYDGAVEAAQRMMNLRPDTASYSRVSYLRQLHGDRDGAIEAMRLAAESASPQNPESIAWCRVQLGNELMSAGRLAEGEREFDHALYAFPDYHAALAAKARARLSRGDTDNAVSFYKRALERVPLPDYAIALGDLYVKLGRAPEAKRQYDLVEFIERNGAIEGTYSRNLAFFWADHDTRLDEALAVAESERAARDDIYTSDLLAWCLYKKNRFTEARAASERALRLGTLDARLLFHAGMIAQALGDRRSAANYLRQALKVDPDFDVLQADVARRTLGGVKG
jgi:tetratricopeptide (TPR) repeat protein